jgi:hypothetical protein
MSEDDPKLEIIVEEIVTTTQRDEDDPRNVVIDVIIDSDQGGGTFHLESDPMTNGVPIQQGYIVEFNNRQNGIYRNGFSVGFRLPSGRGQNDSWTFDPDDPIWVKLVDNHGPCPGNKKASQPGILSDPTLSDGDRTLTVGNSNGVPQFFGFALRFASTSGGKTLTYDPIGQNMNGSSFQ